MLTKELASEQTQHLEELISIKKDLNNSFDALTKLISILEDTQKEAGIIEIALYRFAIISFFKCFGGGIRKHRITKDLYKTLPGSPIQLLDYFKNTRDKYLAHSVNQMEQHSIGVSVDNYTIQGIAVLSASFHLDEINTIRHLHTFVEIAIKHIHTKQSIEESRLLTWAKTLSNSEIDKLKEIQITTPELVKAASKKRV